MSESVRVTVWNEFRHEKTDEHIRRVYPQGIHGAIAGYLEQQPGLAAQTATLDEPEHGLTEAVLAETDVLIWWGHQAHGDVEDAIVDRVQARVLDGMGLICLHSSHFSKIFKQLMGTTCNLKWREIGENERLWVVDPSHPIAAGVGQYIDIPHEEMYGEFFDIPQPDRLVFISWFPGRRGLPQRLLLPPRTRQGILFSSRTRDIPHVLSSGGAPSDRKRRALGSPLGRPAPVFGNVQPLEEVTVQE